jgi:hypothetical protein
MLTKPSKGISRSIKVHKCDLDGFCDWIEGTLLFQADPEISAPDIVSFLTDDQIYVRQEFAWEMIANAWKELRRRENILGVGYPIQIEDRRLTRKGEWRDSVPLSFCLMLSFAKWYDKWVKQFGKDFTEQGELFEALSKESLEQLLPGWRVHQTGWTRKKPNTIKNVVSQVATLLDELPGNTAWASKFSKDSGLDLVCFRPFEDNRAGQPVYFFQCASGTDWAGKLHTPNLLTWAKIVDFASLPRKAFTTPFSWRNPAFRIHSNLIQGFVLDRFRILAPGRAVQDWLSPDLRGKLIAWLEPRVAALPWA